MPVIGCGLKDCQYNTEKRQIYGNCELNEHEMIFLEVVDKEKGHVKCDCYSPPEES